MAHTTISRRDLSQQEFSNSESEQRSEFENLFLGTWTHECNSERRYLGVFLTREKKRFAGKMGVARDKIITL